MADTDITLGIEVDAKKAVSDLKDFKRNADSVSKNVASAFGAIKVAAAAALAVFAGREVIQFFSEGIDAANAQEKAMAQLGQQLKLTGGFSKDAMEDFAEFSDQMELTTKYGDDLIISQLAVAKSFNLTNDESKKLVKAATELSAVTGDSLESSVEQLGKTFDGIAGKSPALKNALQGISKEALISGAGIDAVLKRFGGSAVAEIETFSGSLLQARNAFGNLQESIGDIVINNKTVIKTIQVFAEAFRKAQEFIENNKDSIDDFISISIKSIAVSVPVAVDIIGFFIRALEGLVTVGTLAFGGLLEVASTFAGGFGKVIQGALDIYLGFAETLVRSIDDLPIVGKAFETMGIDVSGAADGIATLKDGIKTTVDEGVTAIGGLRDSTIDFAVKSVAKFEEFNKGFSGFQEGIDVAVQSIFDADSQIIQSAQDTANAEINIAAEREAKLSAIREENAKKASEKAREDAKKLREEIEAIAAKPIKFLVDKAPISQANISTGSAKGIAAGVGILDQGLSGADGAKQAISQGIGAAADAFLPGIGGAVGSIVGKLAEGPEATKAFIKDFIAAIPDIITNIAESAPIVVEALIESLIEDGGLMKIAAALLKALSGEAALKSIGRMLGIDFGDAFNADKIAETLSNGIKNALSAIPEFFADAMQGISDAFSNIFGALPEILNTLLNPMVHFQMSVEYFQKAVEFFSETPAWLDDITAVFNEFYDNIYSLFSWFTDSFYSLFNWFNESFYSLFNWFTDAVSGIFDTGDGGGFFSTGTDGDAGTPYATGGVVPPGYPNDSHRAWLSSNERVLNVKENTDMTNFLDDYNSGNAMGGGPEMIALLSQIAAALRNPQTVQTTIQIDSNVLAKAMLNLNRRNARTA